MKPAGQNNDSNPWGSLDPYAQLIRALLPRATSVAAFDAAGSMRWSSDTTTGPDLMGVVESTLDTARTNLDSPGLVRVLEGNLAIYLCWLRDDASRLLAIIAIASRAGAESEPRTFSFVHALLRPALECLRRDLLAHAAIECLTDTVAGLDADFELLLADAADPASAAGNGPDELRSVAQSAVEHLKCAMAALIIPDKNVALLRTAPDCKADGQLLARTHRQLLSMAQLRPEPTIINRTAPAALGPTPYRILLCPVRQPNGRNIGVLALFRDAAKSEFVPRDARLAEALARRAGGVVHTHYDAGSGLYTRAALEQRLRSVLGEVNGPGVLWSALYIDSDQLHIINESCGMHVGDTVIAQLGELIRARLPPGALAARLGGDRFAVLLPSAVEVAAQFAEALRAGATQLGAAHAEARAQVSVSVGVAALATGVSELTHALAAAETACRAAKQLGRNCVSVYRTSEESGARHLEELQMAAGLREAIAGERLRLEAQLIVPFDPALDARPHYELFVRMLAEDGTRVGPDKFLTAANRHHLMPAIDRWVIERGLALLGAHAALLREHPAVFAFNCSGQSLSDEAFGDFLVGALVASGLDPAGFCFEFAESAAIANLTRAEALIRRLRRLGCEVALDDFGTGLSSLSHLRQLPVTLLKIDGSFVRDVLKDARAESMVQAVAQLARGMSLRTVAECVETEEIRARLATLGVDYGQGFAIGRPEPFDEVLAWLPMLAAAAPAYAAEPEPAPMSRVANLQ